VRQGRHGTNTHVHKKRGLVVIDSISMKRLALKSSVATFAALAAFGVMTPAMAQTAAAGQGDEETLEDIVVTGSRIARPNLESAAPVTVVGAEAIKEAGVNKIEDLFNQLPQVFTAQSSGVSNGANGTATVDLRNLGANRTLVLLDGRRLMPGAVTGNSAADLNFIPAALIQRVDILTGGASSTYGADAVAGVVNFTMNRKFEGVRIDANYNFYQHNNNNELARDIVNRRFTAPEGSVTHGGSFDATMIIGTGVNDGAGNVVAYVGYRKDSAITQDAYDYSVCTLNPQAASASNPNTAACGGSGTPAFTRLGGFTIPSLGASPGGYSVLASGITPYSALRDAYNFAPLNYYRRPSTRYTAGVFADYEINEHFKPFIDAQFMDYSTNAQIAPSGAFYSGRSVNCNNPFLLANNTLATAVCGTDINTNANRTILIGKRNVEGGPRFNEIGFNQFRLLAGVKGDITEAWKYEVSLQTGQVNYAATYRNDVSNARIDRALQVVNVNGVPTCRSVIDGSDPSCVPYNVFGAGTVTAAAANYIAIPLVLTGETKQTIVSGFVTGDLGKAGIQSPWAENGVAVVLGAEYRKESLSTQPDLAYINNDGAGQGGPTLPISGSYTVRDIFGEMSIPLASDAPFAHNLEIGLGYRYSTYKADGQSTSRSTWKITADWAPIEDFRLRGSFNRANRAPNIADLFTTPGLGLWSGSDPCVGAAPTATQAQCALTGLPANLYGTLAPNTAQQYNQVVGGNTAVEPEKVDTWTLGVVIEPKSILPNFNMTVDYFNIKVTDAIGVIGSQIVINQCIATGNPDFCSKIRRAPASTGPAAGSLWLDDSGFIDDSITNTGGVKTSGVDVAMQYRFDINDESSLSLTFAGTWLDKFVTQPFTGGFDYDCAGFYGTQCATTLPTWRHSFRVRYDTPWPVAVSLTWRYISSVKQDTSSTDPDLAGGVTLFDEELPSFNYFDLNFQFPVTEKLNLGLGIRNLFDKDPPLITQPNLPGTIGNGNTIVGTYDYLGRYIFMNATIDF
jgi:iron complex outermembrane recepter protein